MALYVNTNVSSLNANRQLSKSTKSLDTSYQRLASGLRINNAKDDAAGLQISNRMTSQINGLNQGNRNAQDGISYAQTAEGAMDEMTTMYQRIRTLALQSANGTNSSDDRKALQQEVTQLCAEIDRISADTTFGGQKILDGTAGSDDAKMTGRKNTSFQVGADQSQTIGISLGLETNKTYKADDSATEVEADDKEAVYVAKKGAKAVSAADAFNDDGDALKAGIVRAEDGKYYKTADAVDTGRFTDKITYEDSAVKEGGTKDIVKASDNKFYDKTECSVTEVTSKGWSVKDVADSLSLTTNGTEGWVANTDVSESAGAVSFDISTAEGAQAVVGMIDKFIGQVDSKRAELGAVENRLESTMRNQSNIVENLSDARSQIRDTDFATETANMTQTSIIQQASQSILSQANQRPQLALSLMG